MSLNNNKINNQDTSQSSAITRSLATSAEEFRRAIKKGDAKVGSETYDLIIVGGGITGAGILREAARRGLKVLLLEQKDFAWGTSSRSSKMVHGGLRYLAEGHIRLTRESVRERQRYLEEVPGLVDLMKYLMIHKPKQFPPRWLFQQVLRVYDFFAGKRYRASIDKKDLTSWLGVISPADATGGSVFADAITDDSRLVIRALTEAVNDRGVALNYSTVDQLLKDEEGRVCGVKVKDSVLDQSYELKANVVINATGAWARRLSPNNGPIVRPLRGSHLVFPFWRLPVSCSISLLHPKDNRPMFVYPWQGATIVGTTDLDHKTDLNEESSICQEEVDYLLEGANSYLTSSQLTENDVVSSWSGVRPVVSSGKGVAPSRENRDHTIWQEPGLISVSGGKLTTFRVIAFDVLNRVFEDQLQRNGRVQDTNQPFFTSTKYVSIQLGKLSGRLKRRLSGKYGIKAFDLVSKEQAFTDIEQTIGATEVSWAELEWAVEHEGVVHLDDLLLRRTSLGHVMPKMSEECWLKIKAIFQTKQDWSESRWQKELTRYHKIWTEAYALPSKVSKTQITESTNSPVSEAI